MSRRRIPILIVAVFHPDRRATLQFHCAGVLIAEYLATLRIDPGHHVPDRAIFPRSVHRLKYQKDGMAI